MGLGWHYDYQLGSDHSQRTKIIPFRHLSVQYYNISINQQKHSFLQATHSQLGLDLPDEVQ